MPVDNTGASQYILHATRRWGVAKVEKIAIQLDHQYTQTNMSFGGIKGRDRVIADAFANASDANGSPLLEVHLAIIEKMETGSPSGGYDYGRYKHSCPALHF